MVRETRLAGGVKGGSLLRAQVESPAMDCAWASLEPRMETAPTKPANSYQPTQLAGRRHRRECLTEEYLDTGAVL